MFNNPKRTSIEVNDSVEGETIEKKVKRIKLNNEPIEDTAPTLYTLRGDGVLPETDVRADKWESAITAREQAAVIRLTKKAKQNDNKGSINADENKG